MEIIPYGTQSIEESDIEAVVKVLQGKFLTQGPAVQEFEDAVSAYLKKLTGSTGDLYAVAVNNGTTALHLACLALGVKKGSKVLVTSNSFAASANCVRFCGGEVEFVDIELEGYHLDVGRVESIVKAAPKGTYQGIVAVDFAGSIPDLKRLRKLADEHGLFILEDACHAIGGVRYDTDGAVDYAAGDCRYSDLATFSFHPVKHIATGEGGMILTRSKVHYEKLKLLRTHGITKDPALMKKNDGGWYYEMQELSQNGRISDILCALGLSQMKRLDQNLFSRRKIADRYFSELKGLPVILPARQNEVSHAYHLFVIRCEQRKALYDFLVTQSIYAQVHYIPIHQQPYYQARYGMQKMPNCDLYYDTCLSIPMYHSLKDHDQTRVIEAIHRFFKK